jgi:acyl-CoA dehydrogenase
MSEINRALELAVRAACARHGRVDALVGAGSGDLNLDLWSALEQIGATRLAIPEDLGGSGGDVSAAVTTLQVLGEHSAAVPVAETALAAGHLLTVAGVSVPPGPLTMAGATEGMVARSEGAGTLVVGELSRVPWARVAAHLVVLHENRAIVLSRDELEITKHENLAGEPRDNVRVHTVVSSKNVHDLSSESDVIAEELSLRAALARAALMVGAGRRALELSLVYASERSQFGRPIARFQAIQQHLATMATEVLLAKVSVEAAALAMDTDGDARTAVAAAKTVAGQMAAVVSSLSHQVHGAIGYTGEHALGHSTTRLWAWRDEAGPESAWSRKLGREVLAGGTSGLWPLLTSSNGRSR